VYVSLVSDEKAERPTSIGIFVLSIQKIEVAEARSLGGELDAVVMDS